MKTEYVTQNRQGRSTTTQNMCTDTHTYSSALENGFVKSAEIRLATGWTVRESNPGDGEISARVQTGPGAHQASCTIGTVSLSQG